MTTPLLTTKLYIPPPLPNLVERPRLVKRLDEGLHLGHRLTLISAPAGFGKTTLLSEWVHAMGRVSPPMAVAWLSLDEGDNDLTRFLTYFIAALQTIEANMGQGLLAALLSPGAVNVEAALTALLNEIANLPVDSSVFGHGSASGQGLVLVLDDYHVIESQAVDKALTFTLDHLPPPPGGLHLVIASRTDPTLPLSRLRARGQLTELREADLRFTTDEVNAFLKQVFPLPISSDDARTLEDRTEGWITGLQLAAIAMQGLEQREQITRFIHSFGGSHRYVIDYLVDEVLDQQTPGVQAFMLQTSILARMVAPLCNAVSEREDSQAILEGLEAANLFLIPLGNERRWYRYHHLFADLLRFRLRRKEASTIPALHRRASEWHEQNGFIARAIDHAIAADDVDLAARLVEEHYRSALQRGEVSAVLGWLGSLPDDMVRSDPSLSVGYAWGLFLSGQMSAIEARLQDAETVLAGYVASGNNAQAAELFGEIATLRSYLFRVQGDPVRGIELAQQVLEQVSEDNLSARGVLHTILGGLFNDVGDIARASQSYAEAVPICQAAGNIMAAMMAAELLVQLLMMQGQLQRAAAVCRQMQEDTDGPDAQGKHREPTSDLVCVGMGNVLYEWNELDDAEAYVRKGIEQGKQGGFFQAVVFGQLLLARVLQARGDAGGATNMLQEAAKSARVNPPRWYRAELVACQVQLWLAQGNLAAASRWAQASDLSADTEFNQRTEFEHITLARVLIAQGRAESNGTTLSKATALTKALGLLGRLSQAAESTGRMGHLIELLILQALALEAQGDLNRALACLERALKLGEPEGYIRTFVDRGAPMAQLLHEAAAREIMPEYTSKLLSAFGVDDLDDTTPPPQPLIEPLSPRELEVLGLIAQGLSNREVSEQLSLALSTVKGHNQNIYGKLQVQRRTEAIARARELGLL